MSALSFSLSRGVDGFQISDFTIGTSAPGAGDFELRIDLTTNTPTRLDVIKALEAFERAIESGAIFSTSPKL